MIYNGDCLEVLSGLDENSIDTCITDPPYELGFMGKKWDSSGIAFQPETWQAVFRVLKPGAILLAFGGTRTYHRIACAIEDAGFEIRDTIAWVYGSGFPKSYDISKGIDKRAGAEREIIGWHSTHINRQNTENWNKSARPMTHSKFKTENSNTSGGGLTPIAPPSTPEAQLWHGWGTALKPAFEPIVVAMKPIDGTYVNNALTWGVAGLWIDGGRVAHGNDVDLSLIQHTQQDGRPEQWRMNRSQNGREIPTYKPEGRFPANFIHDGSGEVVGLFPQTTSGKVAAGTMRGLKSNHNVAYADIAAGTELTGYGDSGSAARFFYCAKASRSERNAGLEGMAESKVHPSGNNWAQTTMWNGENGDEEWRKKNPNNPQQNHHPTVKPIELMRYLVRLTKTPTGGVVLDPFTGSGTTGIACELEGREFIGIEREPEYVEIAEKRIAHYRLPILEEVE